MPGPESETLTVWISALTDTGKVRRHNEDYIGYLVPENHGARAIQGALMVVCDGVGGGSAGEVASERAVHRILDDYYTQSTSLEIEDRLLAAIQQANAELYAENQHDPEARPMSTTVVAALIVGRDLLVAHAGDSRAYLARGSQITQVTTDHSWVAEMVAAGDLTPEEAEKHPWRNRITRGLGLKEEVELDVQEIALEARDVILLCSDGLTRHVGDDEILDTVTRYSQERAVQHLVRLANMRGGKDNISALIAEVLTETELATRLSQAEVADEETQVPVQPRCVVDRRELRRILPLAAAAALLLLLCGIGVRALQQSISSPTSTPTATATMTRPSEILVRATPVPRGKTTSPLYVRPYPSTEQWNPAVGMLKSGVDFTISFLSKQSETCTGSACCNSNIWFEVIVPNSQDAWEQVPVQSSPVTGWVCADYVELLEGVGSEAVPTKIPQPPIPTATTVPSHTPTGMPTPTPTHAPTPSATLTPTATPNPSPSPTARPRPIVIPAESAVLDGPVQAAVFLSDGHWVGVILTGQIYLYRWNPEGATGPQLSQQYPVDLSGESNALSLAALLNNRLLVGFEEGSAQSFQVTETGQLIPQQNNVRQGSAAILAASPDGLLLARRMAPSQVQIWQADGKEPLSDVIDNLAPVRLVSFAPSQTDLYQLVSGSEDGTRVCLWKRGQSLGKPSKCLPLPSHLEGLTSIALSKEGTVVATGAGNGQIRLWETSEGAEYSPQGLRQHTDAVKALAFSPDGKFLLSASENDGIKLWGVP